VATFSQIFIDRGYALQSFLQAGRLRARATAGAPAIVDCGANVGCSVVWFATEFPGAQIVAVEPEAGNFTLLRHNVRDLPNVRCVQAAIWSSSRDVAVVAGHAGQGWAFRTAQLDGADSPVSIVPGVTLPALIEQVHAPGPLIVKIDVEGAEDEIFKANTDWLRRIDLLIIELHDWMLPWRGTSRNLFQATAALPFDYCIRGENLFCFLDRAAAAHFDAVESVGRVPVAGQLSAGSSEGSYVCGGVSVTPTSSG